MTASTLVARAASTYYLAHSVKKMGLAHVSAGTAAARVAVLKVRRKQLSTGFRILASLTVCVLLALSIGIMFYPPNKQSMSFAEEVGLTILMFGLFSVLAAVVLAAVRGILLELWAREGEARWLMPIHGTYECEKALRHFRNGGPLVAEWRDIAIAERGQLHSFDVEIMAGLHAAHQDETEKAAYDARQEAACKEVHGITPATSAASLTPLAG
jgi:hypothetical protein